MIRLIGSGIKAISDLFRSSSLLFLANAFVNICNLLFWLFMVRRLSAVDYGVLNSLLSVLMVVALPTGTFQTVVTKFVSQFHSLNQKDKIKCFLFIFGKRLLLLGFGLFLFFIIFSKNIAGFLQIESVQLVRITGMGLFFSVLLPVTMGALQGLQHFIAMAVTSIANGVIKLSSGIFLVGLGLRTTGALCSFILASLASFLIAAFFIPKKILKVKSAHISELKLNHIYSYFFPVAISLFCFTALINSDVILVKHFFSPLLAGKYSIVQMVGKIILFLPGTIGIVLFPKMTEAITKRQRVTPLLLKGLILAGALCIIADIVCFIHPSFVLETLTRKSSLDCISLVPLFCIAMTFFALVQILIFYYLSIHSLRFLPFLAGAAILQAILIVLFHSSLAQVLSVLVLISSLLFILGLLNVDWRQ